MGYIAVGGLVGAVVCRVVIALHHLAPVVVCVVVVVVVVVAVVVVAAHDEHCYILGVVVRHMQVGSCKMDLSCCCDKKCCSGKCCCLSSDVVMYDDKDLVTSIYKFELDRESIVLV